jgi:hypothetical protein
LKRYFKLAVLARLKTISAAVFASGIKNKADTTNTAKDWSSKVLSSQPEESMFRSNLNLEYRTVVKQLDLGNSESFKLSENYINILRFWVCDKYPFRKD